ncbi:MAG: pyocin activator PrtN family protein [Hyphomicrobiales bacterium]|nr:pyocin activator PrtN family protein [Hyphomicrobiales bacterium]
MNHHVKTSPPSSQSGDIVNTTFLLMAQYHGRAIIPVDVVCRDYFSHLTPDKFLRKQAAGEIDLPLVRIEASQKAAKGVHLSDLAAYLDRRREAAVREHQALHS